MIQFEFSVVPSIVKKEARTTYITGLSSAQEEKHENVFLSFMREHHCSNLEDQIEEYKASMDSVDNETINLSASEGAVLAAIRKERNRTIAETMERCGLSRASVTRAIASLKEKQKD